MPLPKLIHRIIRRRRQLLLLGSGSLFGITLLVLLGYVAGLRPDSHWAPFARIALPSSAVAAMIATIALFRAWRGVEKKNPVPMFASAAVILLASLGLVSFLSINALNNANAWVRHTFEVKEMLANVLIDLSRAESICRYFSPAADPNLESEYVDLIRRGKQSVAAVVDLVADNPEQLTRARRMRELAQAKLDYMETVMQVRRHRSPLAEERIVQARQLLELNVSLTALVDKMVAEEQRLLTFRSMETQRGLEQTRRLLFLGSLAAVALVALVLVLMQQAEQARSRAEQALFASNQELRVANVAVQESNRLKAQFLANMSHEIRTPMNGVVGMTNLLLDSDLTTEQRSLANTVRSCSDSLLTIINDILDFSKIEAGQLTIDPVPFDLRDCVEDCLSMLAEKAQGKGLELAYLIEENVPTQLVGDAGRLRQVLINLVGNAVKFTARGEVVVRIGKVTDAGARVRLRFAVKDTGIGIAPEAQPKLFQAFVQADGGTTRRFGGTGLGLAICRQLVSLMGGEIGLISAPGEGSTFWFTSELGVQAAAPVVVSHKAELAGRRALVVDDNETNRELLVRQLAAWRINGTAAAGAEEALAALRAESAAGTSFHFAILDMQMPGMSGLQLAQAIHSDPLFYNLKMVLLTSMGHAISRRELDAAGIGAFLMKPARQSHLHDALVTVLSGVPAEPQAATGGKQVSSNISPAELKLRILVAEDNLVNQHVARLQLEKFGYRPDIVADGRQVLIATKANTYDVILMDCQMPELDGYGAARRLREWESERSVRGERFIPLYIIAMTANAMIGDRDVCLAAGMNDYIAKPVRAQELAAALARAPAVRLQTTLT